MTAQTRREPDGEALNFTSFLGSLTAWLETTALPVKETTGNGGLGFSSRPLLRKIKPACLNSLASTLCIREYAHFGRLEDTVHGLLLSLCWPLSQERDIYQAREKMCFCETTELRSLSFQAQLPELLRISSIDNLA